jgi:hypothetical protein
MISIKKYLTPFFLLLIVILTLSACTDRKSKYSPSGELISNSSSIKEIDVKNEDFLIDSILSVPKFIRLETNPNCLIGQIDKLLYQDSLFFIVDRTISPSIMVFNRSGHFLNKISSRGKGPGEFMEIWDVNINSHKRRIELLDEISGRINYYDYDCNFLGYKNIPFLFTGFANLNDTTIVYYTGRASNALTPAIDKNLLVIGSDKNGVLNKAFPLSKNEIDHKLTYETYLAPLWNYGGQIYFNPRYSDTIYRITKDSLVSAYHINMQGKTIPQSQREEMDDAKFDQLNQKYSYLNGNFISLDDFVYIAMISNSGYTHVFYSKKTHKTISGAAFAKENPFFIYFEPPIARMDKNTIVSVQTAYQIMYQEKFIKFDPIKSSEKNEQMKVFKNLNRNDNPVLVLYTFKKF